jgi:hypothetical protein
MMTPAEAREVQRRRWREWRKSLSGAELEQFLERRREYNRERRGLTPAQVEQFLEQERERDWRKPRRRSPEQLERRRNYSREFMRKLRAARKEEHAQ